MANKTILGRDYDRDKNLTYRPQDESGDWSTEPLVRVNILPNQSIVTILLQQHRDLRRFTEILKAQKATPVEKQKALFELIDLWNVYACAEENALYEESTISSEMYKQVDKVFAEHGVAQALIEDLENLNFRFTWNASIASKASILANTIDQHILFEEETVLRKIENLLANEDLLRLGREFIRQFEAAVFHKKASLKP